MTFCARENPETSNANPHNPSITSAADAMLHRVPSGMFTALSYGGKEEAGPGSPAPGGRLRLHRRRHDHGPAAGLRRSREVDETVDAPESHQAKRHERLLRAHTGDEERPHHVEQHAQQVRD